MQKVLFHLLQANLMNLGGQKICDSWVHIPTSYRSYQRHAS